MLAAVLAVWILLASVVAAILYVWDKRAAIKDRPRISENTLLIWSLLGGWPGSLVAGKLIRHKTIKTSYRIQFGVCVLVNVVVVSALIYLTRAS